MNATQFRRLVLSFPEAIEGEHMGHPDFRVGGKVFASLGPDEDWAMVRLTPELQGVMTTAEPLVFQPMNGAWGRQGCTRVELAKAKQLTLREAVEDAWRRTAPKKLLEQYDADA